MGRALSKEKQLRYDLPLLTYLARPSEVEAVGGGYTRGRCARNDKVMRNLGFPVLAGTNSKLTSRRNTPLPLISTLNPKP